MQRLFSTFPGGLPGAGLVLLRAAAAIPLIYAGLLTVVSSSPVLVDMVAAGAAILLLIGLWTPIAGATAVGIELWMAFSRPEEFWPSLLCAAMGLSLILLGPGAWSIDALAYGRKRISISGR